MTKLQRYLNSLSVPEKRALALYLETSYEYLDQIRGAYLRSSKNPNLPARRVYPGAKILLRIAKATNGKVMPEDCRPKLLK